MRWIFVELGLLVSNYFFSLVDNNNYDSAFQFTEGIRIQNDVTLLFGHGDSVVLMSQITPGPRTQYVVT